MNLKENRIGKFVIDHELVRERPDDVMPIMSKVLIVRAEFMFHRNAVEYIAFSDDFDEHPIGEEPPMYMPEIRKDVDPDTGNVSIHLVGLKRAKS